MNEIKESIFDISKIPFYGNKFLIGNGYLGVRGTLDEFRKQEKVAINLNGVYDQIDDLWCESINTYNPFYTICHINNNPLTIYSNNVVKHEMILDINNFCFKRNTIFNIDDNEIVIESKRFASLLNDHQLGLEYTIKSKKRIEIEIQTGIDLDVWDLNGPHLILDNLKTYKNKIETKAITKKNKYEIFVEEQVDFDNDIKIIDDLILHVKKIIINPNQSFTFHKTITIYTSLDKKEHKKEVNDYQELWTSHLEKAKSLWNICEVKIEEDNNSSRINDLINYNIYQLLIASPRNQIDKSIPARALSGQVYKGAVFWDTEMFMLPFFLLTDKNVAKELVNYRILGLKGAKEKAKEFGFDGAFYAWESTTDGIDECSLYNMSDAITKEKIRTYFKDKQIHISGDIFYALMMYLKYTNDLTLLYDGGLEMALEIVKFYYSFITYNNKNNTYDVNDVTGPDEYHERVNNNAFTNALISYCFNELFTLLNKVKEPKKSEIIKLTSMDKILEILPFVKVTKPKVVNNVIEQFVNYFSLEDIKINELLQKKKTPNEYLGGKNGLATNTQIIKQADVLTMIYLFRQDFSREEIKANFNYYQQRTEHGSTLSHSMYALTASIIDEADIAFNHFMASAITDYDGTAKEYAGGIYIGGTHPASSGGAYMTLIYGFSGLNIVDNQLQFKNRLPNQIKRLSFNVIWHDLVYHVMIEKGKQPEIKVGDFNG